jgi:hypothetical protein
LLVSWLTKLSFSTFSDARSSALRKANLPIVMHLADLNQPREAKTLAHAGRTEELRKPRLRLPLTAPERLMANDEDLR